MYIWLGLEFEVVLKDRNGNAVLSFMEIKREIFHVYIDWYRHSPSSQFPYSDVVLTRAFSKSHGDLYHPLKLIIYLVYCNSTI